MPTGEASVPVSGGSGYNVRTIKVTQWVIDPTTGVGAWADVAMQVLVLSDKRGDPIDNDHLITEVISELRAIRGLLEETILKL